MMRKTGMSKEKSKKPFEPPRLHTSLGISANIAIGPLGFRAELDPQDENPRPARISSRDDNSGDPGFPTPETSIPDVGDDGDVGNRIAHAEERVSITERGEGESAVVSTVPEKGETSRLPILVDPAKETMTGFGPLRVALEAICAVSAESEATVAIRNKIANLLQRIDVLDARFATRPDDVEDQRRRFELIDKLEGIEEQLLPLHKSQELHHHADNSQGSEDVFNVLEDIQDVISDYQIAHQKAVWLKECGSMDPAETSVLNAFRCAREAEYRHGDRKGCLKGTRRAVLDEIELWSRDFDKRPIYWLNGLAGTGKSTIAQTIAERLHADGRLGASFFCSRDFEDRSDLRFIFPTLAVQLAQRYVEFRSVFVPLARSDSTIAYETLYDQMDKLILQPLVKSAISTVIVIDALDECKDEEPASAILLVLGQFISQIPNVKFFLTGRPESRILQGFRLPLLVPVTDVFILHKVESIQVNSDIRVFFSHKLSELATRRHGLDNWPSEQQLDLLCERTAGLFVYAVASVRFIDHRNSNPTRQLDRLLQSQSSVFEGKTKFNANKTLDLLYTSILQEAFGDDDPEDDPKVRSILGAVVLAANPLSPTSIATLLGLGTGDVFPPLSSVHSLLILHDDVDQPVRPFHKSFPDFIVNPARCAEPRFCLCPADNHTELAIGCLRLLDQKLERNMCKLPDGVANSEVHDLKERTERSIDQVLEYACRSWHKHLAETPPARRPDITPALHRFLERKFLFWLEVLSVLGATREAVDALETSRKLLGESPTLDLVNDCFRFVVTFFEAIHTSSPHIYHSALLLSPRTSIIRQLYEPYTRPLARVVHGLPISWEPTAATAHIPQEVAAVAWSPCSKFVALAYSRLAVIEILDATTLGRIKTFSPSPDTTHLLSYSPDGRLLTAFGEQLELTSWDLQTGCTVCTTPPEADGTRNDCYSSTYSSDGTRNDCYSSTYSSDGKMIAVVYRIVTIHPLIFGIRTYNLVSGEHIFSHHSPKDDILSVWTHGERLRFATAKLGYITILEAEFTSIGTLAEVEVLPLPDEVSTTGSLAFDPTLCRLISISGGAMVWDIRNSKLLQRFKDHIYYVDLSPDGRFFAYTAQGAGVHVWKESPTGYAFHQGPVLSNIINAATPLFSPNGESIIAHYPTEIHLWHITSLPSTPNKPVKWNVHILGFSADETLAAVTQAYENTVTILDLKSGEPRSTIDVGMKIWGMRMTEGAIVVIGEGKVVTWNLPAGDCALNARVNTNDSVRTMLFDCQDRASVYLAPASISPDLGYIAIVSGWFITLYDASTGKYLAQGKSQGALGTAWFTPDTREVWCGDPSCLDGWAIGRGELGMTTTLDPIDLGVSPSGGFPCEWSRGYEVSSDGWVLGPSRKRLLWLPHHWRSDGDWTWGGRFLGLFHHTLPEVVILEFYE